MNIDEKVQLALKHHQSGNLQQAENIYREILRDVPNNVYALHYLGILYYQLGNYDSAIEYIRKVLEINPTAADAFYNLGNVYKDSGNLSEAINCFNKSLELNPQNADGYNNQGIIYKDNGQLDEAITSFKKAIELNPNHVIAYYNLGSIYRDKKQFDNAISCYTKVLELNPNIIAVYFNLGVIHQEKKQLNDAINYYQKVIKLNPKFADAYCNLGIALQEKGKFEDAINYYQKAIEINPNSFDTYNNLGTALQKKGRSDDAITCYQRAIQLNPNLADTYVNLGNALKEHAKIDEAITAYDRAINCNPDHMMAHWARCISHLRIIYQDSNSIQNSRSRYLDELIRLCDTISLNTPQDIETATKAVGSCQPFYLAYQGLNNRKIQKIYGDLVCRIMALRYPKWSNVPTMPFLASNDSVRVGIVSGFFNHHSVWKIPIRGWVENIDKIRFSLYGYYTVEKKDKETEVARQHFRHFVEDTYSFEELCQIIRKDNLHILIYPEIGMDPMTLRLAALRLAPVQCTSWGHPDTSGLPTIDYFLSSDLMEPPDAEEHYTEKLIRLPNLSIYYIPLEFPLANVNRKTFGFRQNSILYLCCQSLFKYLPQYDEIYPRIAKEVSDCQFIFISHKSSYVTEQFQRRIDQSFNKYGLKADNYVIFLPRLDSREYNAINSLSNIFLDTIGWSGCNSTLEAIAHDLPIVSLSGQLMRSRHTTSILNMMGITDTIASTLNEYIELAVKLGKDTKLRQYISNKIAANKHLIYKDKACITALEDFLESVVKERYEQEFKDTN